MDGGDVEVVVLADLFDRFDVLLNKRVAQISTLFAGQYSHESLLLVDNFGLLEDACHDYLLALLLYLLDGFLSLLFCL